MRYIYTILANPKISAFESGSSQPHFRVRCLCFLYDLKAEQLIQASQSHVLTQLCASTLRVLLVFCARPKS